MPGKSQKSSPETIQERFSLLNELGLLKVTICLSKRTEQYFQSVTQAGRCERSTENNHHQQSQMLVLFKIHWLFVVLRIIPPQRCEQHNTRQQKKDAHRFLHLIIETYPPQLKNLIEIKAQ